MVNLKDDATTGTTRQSEEKGLRGEIICPALDTRRSNLDYELAISRKSIFKPGNRWWRARGAHNLACDERLGISSLISFEGLKLSHNKTPKFTSSFGENLFEDKTKRMGLESDISLIPFFIRSCERLSSSRQGDARRGRGVVFCSAGVFGSIPSVCMKKSFCGLWKSLKGESLFLSSLMKT